MFPLFWTTRSLPAVSVFVGTGFFPEDTFPSGNGVAKSDGGGAFSVTTRAGAGNSTSDH